MGTAMTPKPIYKGAIHPPFNNRITELRPAPIYLKLKKLAATVLAGSFFASLIWIAGRLFDLGWLQSSAIGIVVIMVCVGLILALMAKIAPCPYCGEMVGGGVTRNIPDSSDSEAIECEHCFEPLAAENGRLRPLTDVDLMTVDSIEIMALENGLWPPECIVCGAPPTHFEGASVTKPQYSKLLLGSVAVQSGKISGIPYCDRHTGLVALNVRDDALRVVFPRLDMARRYLAVNTTRKAVKIA